MNFQSHCQVEETQIELGIDFNIFFTSSLLSDKIATLRNNKSNSGNNLRNSSLPRIIDTEDIKAVSSDSHRYLEDSKAVNPDEVYDWAQSSV